MAIQSREECILVCGGPAAVEFTEYLQRDIAAGCAPVRSIVGFVDDSSKPTPMHGVLPYLGTIETLEEPQRFAAILALGDPPSRHRVADRMRQAGLVGLTYIHPSAWIASSARIAAGAIICPNAIVNANARVGEFAVVNVFGSVGHDATLGAYSIMAPYAAINGYGSVGEECLLATRATVFPRVSIGRNCTIDSHSYARANVEDNCFITTRGNYNVLKKRI